MKNFKNSKAQRFAAIKALREVLKPPPDLTVSQWADRYRMLSSESSSEFGRWSTDRAPYQREIMDTYTDPAVSDMTFVSSAQVGKALAIDTLIPTPSGWVQMADLSAGDTVFGIEGQPVSVLASTEVMLGHECFEVEFSDGSVIVADADHQWYVEPHRAEPEVKTTRAMVGDFRIPTKKGHRNRYAVPVAGALDCLPRILPIDPYCLGAWLGDGHSYSGALSAHADDVPHMEAMYALAGYRTAARPDGSAWKVSIDPVDRNFCLRGHDKRVVGAKSNNGCAECGRIASRNAVRRRYGHDEDSLPPVTESFVRSLRKEGLLENKHIPEQYLRASRRQRLALLQGLMDTDGCIGLEGRCEYVTTSPKLADGVADLLCGLGIKHTRKLKKIEIGKDAFRFSFLVYDDLPVFRMPRKLARMVSREGRRTTETERRRIVDIRPAPSVPVKCIQVDGGLYLAGRSMIPTHNSECLLNMILYALDQRPGPILTIQPTLDMCTAWAKDRFNSAARDTPKIREKIKLNSRDGDNTILHRKGPGWTLVAVGSNSPASLASRPIRDVFADEIDRFEASAGAEGDPLNLCFKRTNNFWNRFRARVSTPTILGASRIMDEWENSDQRRYHVPCIHCGHEHILEWANVFWDKTKDDEGRTLEHHPETAHMACPGCGGIIEDRHKSAMLAKGRWIAAKPFRGHAGFHLNELYSPWRKFGDVAQAFLEAKSNPEALKVWVNTSLGEPFEEDAGQRADPEVLLTRLEEYPAEVPLGAHVLTAGVDVQADRIEIQVDGFSADGSEERWFVDYEVLYGDPEQQDIWDQLDRFLSSTWQHECGIKLGISGCNIDSGHHTQMVYEFCRTRHYKRIHAVKGQSGEGRPFVAEAKNKHSKRKTPLFLLGVDDGKGTIMARLGIDSPGPGYWHFPKGHKNCGMEYFRQLTAEKKVKRYRFGRPYFQWVADRPRNEALDVSLYSLAAFRMLPRSLLDAAKDAVHFPNSEQPKRVIRRQRGQFR